MFRFYVTGILLTGIVIAGGLVAVVLVAGLPMVMGGIKTLGPARWVGLAVEWPFLIVFAMGAITLVYRYGPDHNNTKWRYASPGVITATILWIVRSSFFSLYLYHFKSYNRAYGSLGALLVLLTWPWLSAFVVLLALKSTAKPNGISKKIVKAGMSGRPKHLGPLKLERSKSRYSNCQKAAITSNAERLCSHEYNTATHRFTLDLGDYLPRVLFIFDTRIFSCQSCQIGCPTRDK